MAYQQAYRMLRAPMSVHVKVKSQAMQRYFTTSIERHSTSSHLPRIANPSIWKSMVPRSLRKHSPDMIDVATFPASKPPHWTSNPGLPLIVLGLIVGSFAINIIALRREMVAFTRQTETKLELLREVLGKVKAGEKVDVKRLLGTGDPKSEAEWEEVIQELESTKLLDARRERRFLRQAAEQEKRKSSPSWSSTKADSSSNVGSDKPKFIM